VEQHLDFILDLRRVTNKLVLIHNILLDLELTQ